MKAILADACITELKRNLRAVIEAADGEPVAIIGHNKPGAYLVPATTYKHLLDRQNDPGLAEKVRAHAKQHRLKVKLDEL